MFRALALLACWTSLTALAAAVPSQPVDWVNPRIGTAGASKLPSPLNVSLANFASPTAAGYITASYGQTYPATGVPFGMTQWTPQTRAWKTDCDAVAPYYDEDQQIQGFRATHFMSGSCTRDYGSLTLMPVSGVPVVGLEQRASDYSRASEVMTPYLYAVTLTRYKIRVAMAGTSRSGIFRIRFRGNGKQWMLIQANASKGEGDIHIIPSRNEITAVNPVGRIDGHWGKPAGIAGYYVIYFNHPFHVGGTWSGDKQNPGKLSQQGGGRGPGAYVSFDLKPGETLEARIGSSFTSLDEAQRNLEAEIPGWNFDKIVRQSKGKWNQALSRIKIDGTATERHIFYTALYHALLLPRVYNNVDGTYPGFDGTPLQKLTHGSYYGDYSMWDIYNAEMPLLTVVEPQRVGDMVQSLVTKGKLGGFLPTFPVWNSYTPNMIGDHANAIIVDAYFKGIRDFDVDEAYRLMRKDATTVVPPSSYQEGRGRPMLQSYLKYGYIPLEDKVPQLRHGGQQVSRTLAYAYDDFLVGRMAQALGKKQDAALFLGRGQNYRNVIDPADGFARGRHEDGSWVTPFDPYVRQTWTTESLPYTYTFFVPQDIPGLIQLLGGREKFIQKVDGMFTGHYYDQGNEPSQRIAYLYDYAGAAWKTQEHVHRILTSTYSNTPDGLPGNDDAGQMSAWYIFSSLGFYPVTPGVPEYAIGTPAFDDATIELPGGKEFHIHAPGVSQGKHYIESATLNGVPLKRPFLDHSQIMAGGTLDFKMSSKPNPEWGSAQ